MPGALASRSKIRSLKWSPRSLKPAARRPRGLAEVVLVSYDRETGKGIVGVLCLESRMKGRKGKERKGKERKGKERKGKERKGKERK